MVSVLTRDPGALTAAVGVEGKATGFLMGGNLDMASMAVGAELPDLAGAILLIESTDQGLGRADPKPTQLMNAGCLAGIAGVAVGQFPGYREASPADGRSWTCWWIASPALAFPCWEDSRSNMARTRRRSHWAQGRRSTPRRAH